MSWQQHRFQRSNRLNLSHVVFERCCGVAALHPLRSPVAIMQRYKWVRNRAKAFETLCPSLCARSLSTAPKSLSVGFDTCVIMCLPRVQFCSKCHVGIRNAIAGNGSSEAERTLKSDRAFVAHLHICGEQMWFAVSLGFALTAMLGDTCDCVCIRRQRNGIVWHNPLEMLLRFAKCEAQTERFLINVTTMSKIAFHY